MESFQIPKISITNPLNSSFFSTTEANAVSPPSPNTLGFDDPILRNSNPSDFYMNQARSKYLMSSDRSFTAKSKTQDNSHKRPPITRKDSLKTIIAELSEIVPEWLISRTDFQKSYQRMKLAESADLENTVLTPPSARNDDEKRALFIWVKSIEYFKNIPRVIIKDICDSLNCFKFKTGETSNFYTVIKKGSKAEYLFIIYRGTTGVYLNDVKIKQNSEGEHFGDIALDKSSPRTADVIAETDAILFAIKDLDYRTIVFNYKNIEKRENCEFLKSIQFFSTWSPVKIQLIGNSLVPCMYKPGDVIYEFGAQSHVFYLLHRGKVEIQTFIDLKQKNRWPIGHHQWNIKKVVSKYLYPIITVSRGEFFGEYEILKDTDRETRAVALESTVCLSLNQADFNNILTPKDKDCLMKNIKLYIPSKAEMEKNLRKKINLKSQNEKILFDAMKIAYLPVDKDSINDNRSKKLKKWMESIRSRKKFEQEKIKSRIIQNITKNKIKRGFTLHHLEDIEEETGRIVSKTPNGLSRVKLEAKSKSGFVTPLTSISPKERHNTHSHTSESSNQRGISVRVPKEQVDSTEKYRNKSEKVKLKLTFNLSDEKSQDSLRKGTTGSESARLIPLFQRKAKEKKFSHLLPTRNQQTSTKIHIL